jgi:hypothetical protein
MLSSRSLAICRKLSISYMAALLPVPSHSGSG